MADEIRDDRQVTWAKRKLEHDMIQDFESAREILTLNENQLRERFAFMAEIGIANSVEEAIAIQLENARERVEQPVLNRKITHEDIEGVLQSGGWGHWS